MNPTTSSLFPQPLLGNPLRTQFPIFKNNSRIRNKQLQRLIFLDSAVSTLKPQSVIDAMVHNMTHDYGSIHRGAYELSVRASCLYEQSRSRMATFIGSSVNAEQVIFTHGNTEGLNLLAHGLGETLLDEHSRIVVAGSEHHANLVPWQQVALRKNCELAFIPLTGTPGKDIRLDLNKAKELISANTRVVALAWMGNVLGQINPVQIICKLAQQHGAKVILDCAQSMTCFDDDPFTWGVDAISFGGHKMYGPTGVGVLAMTPQLIQTLPPFFVGGGMVSQVTHEESLWVKGPAKFEAGTPPITEVAGLTAAVDFIEQLSRPRIHAHCAFLATMLRQGLAEIPEIEIFSPNTGQETIIAFRHQRIHAHDLATILDDSNIAIRAGHHCAWPLISELGADALCRISFGVYSDTDDVTDVLQAIKKSKNVL